MKDLMHHYQLLVNNTIPISQYMQWFIVELTQQNITTKTMLQPNVNVHGTGYAGSIYSAAIATGWTLLKAWYDKHQYETTLLAAEANIKYLRPINNDFFCQAKIIKDTTEYKKLIARLEQHKSCSFPLNIEVICEDNICAILKVDFVFKC